MNAAHRRWILGVALVAVALAAKPSATRTAAGGRAVALDGTRWVHARHLRATGGAQALPTFQRSYTYDDVTYTDRFVGSDPSGQPRTTRIHTVIVPLRFDFGNGVVRDAQQDLIAGRSPLDWVTHSPIFTPTPFTAGGVSLGATQWADAMIRANFWSEGGSRFGYHVLLDSTVAPLQTLTVPKDDVFPFGSFEGVDGGWFSSQAISLIAQLNPDPAALTLFVNAHDILIGGNGFVLFSNYHSADLTVPDGQLHTYVVVSPDSVDLPELGDPAGAGLAHEVSEWLHDPFVDNDAPPWTEFASQCEGYLETGDFMDVSFPASMFEVTTSEGVEYHLEDQVFLDWFTREPHSRSINGWYSFRGASTFSSPCYDLTRFAIQPIEVLDQRVVRNLDGGAGPDAFTSFSGINRRGDIVGAYGGADGVSHGLLLANGQVTTIDVPGALATAVNGINDDRRMVGVYIDAAGHFRGFTYWNGQIAALDPVPNAGTWLAAIAGNGDIGGGYFPSGPNPFRENGLLIHQSAAQTILPLGATDAEVDGFSASGLMTGVFGARGNGYKDTGFVGRPGNFTPVVYGGPAPAALFTSPTGISDHGVLSGFLQDEVGAINAFYVKNGEWSRIGYGAYTYLFGLNEQGVAVGYAMGGRQHGIIVRLRDDQ